MNDDAVRMGLTLIAGSLPFLIGLVIALRPQAKPKGSADDYFLYQRELTPHLFLKTSVGYSLQVAAIVLFLFWTLSYGIRALVVPVAWAFGYVLVYLTLKRKKLDEFLESRAEESQTIHGYVGQGAARWRRRLVTTMAIATIFGLGGTMIAEIDFTAEFLLSALEIPTARFPYAIEFVHVVVLLFTGAYVLWGGYRAVVETDRAQVPLAYASFGIVLLAVCGRVIDQNSANAQYAGVIALIAALFYIMFLLSRNLLLKGAKRGVHWSDWWILGGLGLVGVGVGLAGIVEHSDGTTPLKEFLFPEVEEFWGFGFWGLLSLCITNAAWQFVDISSLQRLKSVKFSSNNGGHRQVIGRGLLATAVEASGVWVLVILFALALRASGVDDYARMASFFGDLTGLALLLLPVLVFAYMTFMMSTADGFISAMSFVAFYDLHREGEVDEKPRTLEERLRRPRWTTVSTILIIYIIYLFLKWRAGGQIDTILYAIYAIQIAILPAVFSRLIWPRWVSAPAGILSVAFGAACGFYVAVWGAVPAWMAEESWYVFAPLATLGGSTVAYVVLAYFTGRGEAE